MAIANVLERGDNIVVIDEQGMPIFTLAKGLRSEDGLKGYTSKTVNVQREGTIYTYDEQGMVLFTTSAPR